MSTSNEIKGLSVKTAASGPVLKMIEKLSKGVKGKLPVDLFTYALDVLPGWSTKHVVKPLLLTKDTNAEKVFRGWFKSLGLGRMSLFVNRSTLSLYPPDIDQFIGVMVKEFKVVTSEPMTLADGEIAITPPKPMKEQNHFDIQAWVGCKCIVVSAPDGSTFDMFLEPSFEKDTYEGPSFFTWAYKKTSLQKDAADYMAKFDPMELKVRTKAPSSVRDDTGTCAVCFRDIVLERGFDPPHMVLHGYERPGIGTILGRCFGIDYPPYELSNMGTLAFINRILKPQIKKVEGMLGDLKAGRVTSLPAKEERYSIRYDKSSKVEITADHPRWREVLEQATYSHARQLQLMEKDLEEVQKLADSWKLRPLPIEIRK